MENKLFVNFLAILITLILFSLWFLPAYMLHITVEVNYWGILYCPIFLLSLVWGSILHDKYFKYGR